MRARGYDRYSIAKCELGGANLRLLKGYCRRRRKYRVFDGFTGTRNEIRGAMRVDRCRLSALRAPASLLD
jgi:hypothetical protein